MMRARLLVYSAVAIALGYVGLMLRATDGHVVPQVADLYLIAQYARAFAEGHPFRYNPGEPPSSGATSLLHTLVLGVAHAVGLRGEWLIAFAIALGAVCYVLTVVLAMRAARCLAGEAEALLAGALVLLCGPVVWGFLYGADTAPYTLLFLWLFERLLAGSAGGVAAAGVLLSLTRPEGLIAGVVLVAFAHTLWPSERRARRLAALPLLAALAVMLLNRVLTGYWASTSVSDKSLFAAYGLGDAIGLVSEYLTDVVRGLLLGLYPAQVPVGLSQGWAPFFLPPLSLLLIVAALLVAPATARAALRVWGLVVVTVYLLVSTNVFIGVHFNRHLLWAFPTFHVLIATGVGAAARRWAPADEVQQRRFFRAVALVMVALGALSTARFAALYGQQAGDMYRREGRAAEWISRNLPPTAVVANLGTSIEYLTGRRSVNLHGVMSPAFFDNLPNEREADTFEALARLTGPDRPSHLLATVRGLETTPSLLELTVAPELYRTTTFGDELVVRALRYDLVEKNRRIFLPKTDEAVRGLAQVDELNLCDRRAEKEHAYEIVSGSGDMRLYGTVRVASYVWDEGSTHHEEKVIDGGRAVLGHEAFDVRTEAGRDLVVVLRTSSDVEVGLHRPAAPPRGHLQIAAPFIHVSVQGRAVDDVFFQPQPGWDEATFRIPAAAVAAGKTHIELTGQYAAFYYWFFQ